MDLQKLGLLMSGIASTTSRDPRYLQTNLAMQDSFQEMKERERMEVEREKQDLLLRRLANPSSQDMMGTPATKAFEVNGRMVGQNAPAQMQQVMPDQMRLRSLQRAMPKQFMAAELEQLLAGPAKPMVVGENASVIDAQGRELYRNQGAAKEPKLETIFDAQGREIKVIMQPDGSYKPVGSARALGDGSGLPNTSLNPTYGTDAQGNVVLMQANNRGQMVRSVVPEGVSPLDPRGLAFERAAGTTGGRAAAERAAEAPATIVTARNSLKNIQDLKNHPNLSSALGVIEGRLPAVAGAQADVVARIEQMQGQAFLQAFESLKGGGQITETEGMKATQAIARLNRKQDPKDFKAALTELEDVVQLALARAERGVTVGVGGSRPPAGITPEEWADMTPEEKAVFK